MKRLILAASLMAAFSVQASVVDCEANFKTFKETATNMLPPNMRNKLSNLSIKVGKIESTQENMFRSFKIGGIEIIRPMLKEPTGELDGKAIFLHNQIYVTCNEDEETNRAVIAHEIGHFIADIYGQTSGENEANVYAAEIFFQSGVDSTTYLKKLDDLCQTGKSYFCDRAAAWRIGLKGG